MSEQFFRQAFNKTIKKCEMLKELEDSIVSCLKNDKGLVTYEALCKLIEFYTYLFQPYKLKTEPTKDPNPILINTHSKHFLGSEESTN